MKKLALSVFAIVLLAVAGIAQRVCASHEHHEQLMQEHPEMLQNQQAIEDQTNGFATNAQVGDRVVVTIPVVFHIVYRTATENISDAQIASQLAVLNADFRKLNADWVNTPAVFSALVADAEVNFCMAQRTQTGAATTGIVRVSTTVNGFGTNDAVKYTAQGGSNAWDRNQYLNLWICNIGGGILGYAQFPGGPAATDGVVLGYQYTGTMGTAVSPFNLGRTGTHEVGHWLNLRHIWGDAVCGNDLVSDTPVANAENYGCPVQPFYSTCTGTPQEMTMNYMDYTDDACMYMFSAGQKTRMQALFAAGGSRVSLTTSQGCVAPAGGGSCSTPTGLAASNITQTSATVSWAAVSGASSYNLQWKLASATTWTTVPTTSTSSNLTGLTAATAYNYQVQTVCTSGSSAYSTASTFTTQSAGGGGGCTENNESNNSRTTAKPIAIGALQQSQISTAADQDYWSFGNTSAMRNIKLSLTTLPADYDLKLRRNSTLLATSENDATTSEQIILNNATVATTYTAHVYGWSGAFSNTSCYTLQVSLSSTAWRTDGSTAGEVTELELEIPVEKAEFALFPNPAQDRVSVVVETPKETSATVTVFDISGRSMAQQSRTITSENNLFEFDLASVSNGIYFVRVQRGTEVSTRRMTVAR